MGTLSTLSDLSNLSVRLLPYLPWIAGAVTINAVGVLEGYLLRSWMGRAQPSSFELASKIFVAGPLVVVYPFSIVWGMINPVYSTPYALHCMIGLVVGTLFPQKFIRFGPNGLELGGREGRGSKEAKEAKETKEADASPSERSSAEGE